MTTELLPTTLLALNCLSLVITSATFALSFLNYGLLSLWVGVGCAIITILYHTAIFALAFRRKYKTSLPQQENEDKPYTGGAVAWVYIILAMWVTAFGLVVQTTIGGAGSLSPSEINAPFSISVQVGELVTIAIEILVIATIAGHCTLAKRRLDKERRNKSDEEKFDFVCSHLRLLHYDI